MTTATADSNVAMTGRLELVTFYLGDLWLGAPVERVHEINRSQSLTPVPGAPIGVAGVMNLRGDVVTLMRLEQLLGAARAIEDGVDIATIADAEGNSTVAGSQEDYCNVIVESEGEHIGLIVDRVGEVIDTTYEDLLPCPANLTDVVSSIVLGVHQSETELLIVLDVDAALAAADSDSGRDAASGDAAANG